MAYTSADQGQLASATPTTLVEGRLYRLGGVIEIDGRASWAPAGLRAWQPANAFAIVEGDEVLLIDTGLAVHADAVVEQLSALSPAGGRIQVMVTRSELDCTSNLGRLASEFEITELYTGGGATNPFDAFDQANAMIYRDRVTQLGIPNATMSFGEIHRSNAIQLGRDRSIHAEAAVLRLLATFWAWDEGTATIFTSDSFTHTYLESADDAVVADGSDLETVTAAKVAETLQAKFEWLPQARTTKIRAHVKELFERWEPERIAPVRGQILEGRDVVEKHAAMLLDVLDN